MSIVADTFEETYKIMREKLNRIIPEIELKYKAELAYEINCLKKERGAIILGHNYMEPALYISVPDIVGDSLELYAAERCTSEIGPCPPGPSTLPIAHRRNVPPELISINHVSVAVSYTPPSM